MVYTQAIIDNELNFFISLDDSDLKSVSSLKSNNILNSSVLFTIK